MNTVLPNDELEAKQEKLEAFRETFKIPRVRPVRCFLCGWQMYYSGHELHEPEIMVALSPSDGSPRQTFYCHDRCWNEMIGKTLELVSNLDTEIKQRIGLECG